MEKWLHYVLKHGRISVTAKQILDLFSQIDNMDDEQYINDMYIETNNKLDDIVHMLELALANMREKKEKKEAH